MQILYLALILLFLSSCGTTPKPTQVKAGEERAKQWKAQDTSYRLNTAFHASSVNVHLSRFHAQTCNDEKQVLTRQKIKTTRKLHKSQPNSLQQIISLKTGTSMTIEGQLTIQKNIYESHWPSHTFSMSKTNKATKQYVGVKLKFPPQACVQRNNRPNCCFIDLNKTYKFTGKIITKSVHSLKKSGLGIEGTSYKYTLQVETWSTQN